AWTLGASKLDAFFSIAVPLSVRGFISAAVLCFAHTLGEFGVVLMVGGNIPGETRVVSIAIFDQVETLNYAEAHRLSLVLVVFAFITLFGMFLVNRRWQSR
ncbi:MAG: ABC transporter permease subunit, partial [Gammaproteobacteria bacterium]|nr:ABC transporter permease subunit [Gammaproteobacteria bacterium]